MGLVNLNCQNLFKNSKLLRTGLICMDEQHPERKLLKTDLEYRF